MQVEARVWVTEQSEKKRSDGRRPVGGEAAEGFFGSFSGVKIHNPAVKQAKLPLERLGEVAAKFIGL